MCRTESGNCPERQRCSGECRRKHAERLRLFRTELQISQLHFLTAFVSIAEQQREIQVYMVASLILKYNFSLRNMYFRHPGFYPIVLHCTQKSCRNLACPFQTWWALRTGFLFTDVCSHRWFRSARHQNSSLLKQWSRNITTQRFLVLCKHCKQPSYRITKQYV